MQTLGQPPANGPMDQALALLATVADPAAAKVRLLELQAAQDAAGKARHEANLSENAAKAALAEATRLHSAAVSLSQATQARDESLKKVAQDLAERQARFADAQATFAAAAKLFETEKKAHATKAAEQLAAVTKREAAVKAGEAALTKAQAAYDAQAARLKVAIG